MVEEQMDTNDVFGGHYILDRYVRLYLATVGAVHFHPFDMCPLHSHCCRYDHDRPRPQSTGRSSHRL